MRLEFLEEPELEFGGGRHVDIRFGLTHLGPLDRGTDKAPRRIRVALVGTGETVEGVARWFEACREEVPAKESRLGHLFPAFPGFREGSCFDCELSISASAQRQLSQKSLADLPDNTDDAVRAAANMFLHELKELQEAEVFDVAAVCVPEELVDLWERQSTEYLTSTGVQRPLSFHDVLKAGGAETIRSPLQLVLPSTYGVQRKRKGTGGKAREAKRRELQDPATRAWNIHTALYYKAGGRPWRVARSTSEYATCYIGISFPVSAEQSSRFTSLAQVFDERGEGMIIRGGAIRQAKDDRVPHLDEEDANRLLTAALERYFEVHKQFPARVVVHKSSVHNVAELAGFRSALAARGIQLADFVSFGSNLDVRLFRFGRYPPLRGTLFQCDESLSCLYTRGSVEFYRTYPGMYVPSPLVFRVDAAESGLRQLSREILALTKMNWNDTQFDHRDPITLAAARRVGAILKHVGGQPASRYAYYM
jgi:hypothetical protein